MNNSVDEFIKNIPELDTLNEYNILANMVSGAQLATVYTWRGKHFTKLVTALKEHDWIDCIKKSKVVNVGMIMQKNLKKGKMCININISNVSNIITILHIDELKEKED